MRDGEDFEVIEVESEEVAEPIGIDPAPPDDPTPKSPPPARPAADYVAVPNPLASGWLLAHNRNAVLEALISGRPSRGLQSSQFDSDKARLIEHERAIRAAATAAHRRRNGQTWYLLIVALGSPFLIASLLGAAGLQLARLSTAAAPLAEFVGSAGASLGGLPLAAAICLIPGAALLSRHFKQQRPAPRFAIDNLKDIVDSGPLDPQFQDAAADLINECRSLVGGRRSIPRSDARRVSSVLERLAALSRSYQGGPAAECYGDLARRVFLAAEAHNALSARTQPRIDAILADYDPLAARRGSGRARMLGAPIGGIVIAVVLFGMAGIFRLADDQFEIVRTNGVWQPPGSINYVDLTRQRTTGVDFAGSDAAISVDGPGWFWALPQPFTRRLNVNRFDNVLSAQAEIGTAENDAVATVAAEFSYVIKDSRAYAQAALRSPGPELIASQASSDLLTKNLQEARLMAEFDADPAAATERLRDGIESVLESVVAVSAQDPALAGLGVELLAIHRFELAEEDRG